MAETVKKTKSKAKAPSKPRKTTSKKKLPATNQTSMSHEEVAMLAHRFFAERGYQHGYHEEDWLRAEQELRGLAS